MKAIYGRVLAKCEELDQAHRLDGIEPGNALRVSGFNQLIIGIRDFDHIHFIFRLHNPGRS